MLYANSRARRHPIGAAGAAGHGHRGQGRHRQTRCRSRQSAGHPVHQLRQADRGGARPPLPVADPQGAARRRAHRRVRPLALRGRADRAGARPGAARGVGRALRRDQRVREGTGRRRARRSSRSRCSSRSTSRRSASPSASSGPTSTGSTTRPTSTNACCGRSTRRPTRPCWTARPPSTRRGTSIPCDRKWYSRLAITELLIEALKGLDLSWPPADFDVEAEKAAR